MILFDSLVSYAFQRKQNNDLQELRNAIGPEALLLIDSGAYTAFTTGQQIKLDEYATFLDQWRGVYDAAITLDVIGDPEATAVNTQRLRDLGHDVLPVHTGAGTTAAFDALCESTDWLCLGGIAGVARQREVRRNFVGGMVHRAARQGVAVHSLGAGSSRLIRTAAQFSCDVSTPSRALLHGGIPLYCKDMGRIEVFSRGDSPAKLRKYVDNFADHGLHLTNFLDPTFFDHRVTRLTAVQAGITAIVSYSHDFRLKLAAAPPARLAGREHGPRVCTALVTKECLDAMVLMVKDGVPIDPMPRALRTRVTEPVA